MIVAERLAPLSDPEPTDVGAHSPTTPKSSLDGVHDSTTDVSAVAAGSVTSVGALGGVTSMAGRRGYERRLLSRAVPGTVERVDPDRVPARAAGQIAARVYVVLGVSTRARSVQVHAVALDPDGGPGGVTSRESRRTRRRRQLAGCRPAWAHAGPLQVRLARGRGSVAAATRGGCVGTRMAATSRQVPSKGTGSGGG